jgi:hypothetical protein
LTEDDQNETGFRLEANVETIALLLGEPSENRWHPRGFVEGAQRLVRSADGQVSLEAVETEEEFDKTARTTGCWRRGKPIRDPETREIIGYEMEEVPMLRASALS